MLMCGCAAARLWVSDMIDLCSTVAVLVFGSGLLIFGELNHEVEDPESHPNLRNCTCDPGDTVCGPNDDGELPAGAFGFKKDITDCYISYYRQIYFVLHSISLGGSCFILMLFSLLSTSLCGCKTEDLPKWFDTFKWFLVSACVMRTACCCLQTLFAVVNVA